MLMSAQFSPQLHPRTLLTLKFALFPAYIVELHLWTLNRQNFNSFGEQNSQISNSARSWRPLKLPSIRPITSARSIVSAMNSSAHCQSHLYSPKTMPSSQFIAFHLPNIFFFLFCLLNPQGAIATMPSAPHSAIEIRPAPPLNRLVRLMQMRWRGWQNISSNSGGKFPYSPAFLMPVQNIHWRCDTFYWQLRLPSICLTVRNTYGKIILPCIQDSNFDLRVMNGE